MAQYQVVWQCKKCGTTLTVPASSSRGGTPNRNGCPDGGYHQWNWLTSHQVK